MLKNLPRKERLKKDLLKVGEVARIVRVLRSTIDYYADIGLLEVDDYMQGKYRLFKKEKVLAQLARIKELKDKGLLLTEIKKRLKAK